MIPKFREAQ